MQPSLPIVGPETKARVNNPRPVMSGTTTWDALVGQARIALAAGSAVLICLSIVDSRLMQVDLELALVLGMRIGLALAALLVGWVLCGSSSAQRLFRYLLVWQVALVGQHAATAWLWPMDLAAHVAALSILLLVYFLFPSTPRQSVALGLGLTAMHLLPSLWAQEWPPAEVLLAALAANGAGYVARVREGQWRLLATAIDAAEARTEIVVQELEHATEEIARLRSARRSEFLDLLETLPSPLVVLDAMGAITHRNADAAALLSGIPEEAVASWLRDLPLDDTVEKAITLPGGSLRTLVATVRGVNVDERSVRLVALAEATRLRSTESALVEARRAVELAVNRDVADRAELAHELRTPLNGIFGFAQVLQESALDAEQRGHIARIRHSAEEMLKVLDLHLGIDRQQAPDILTDSGGLSVLLVEDDDVSGLLARTLLERDGHRVVLATNGRDAVNQATKGGFDVILMDIRLPILGGPAATRRIRALPDPKAASVPIVAMTANVLPAQIARYKAVGMQTTLSKPVDRDRLRAILAEVMGHRPSLAVPKPISVARIASMEMEPDVLDVTVLDGHREVLGAQRLAHVIDSFLRASPGTLATIRDASADHDLTALAKAAHKLGSGALTVGLKPLGALCREAERLAEAGNDIAARETAAALDRAFGPGIEALQHYLRQLTGNIPANQTTSAASL